MTKSLRPLTVPFLALILIALVGVVVITAPPAAAQSGVPPVTNIQLAPGPNSGEVVISWNAVPQATHYRIGYVNMEVDYHLAKASCEGEWIEAFIYVDVNARNFPVNNGRAEYTIRRLVPGAKHAFTVLTSNNFVDSGGGGSVRSEFFWPSNPRWKFLPGRHTLPAGVTLPSGECSAPATSGASDTPLSTAEVAQRVRPALVKLIVRPSDGQTYSGTGFIVRSDGLVVTNRHVVDDAGTVTAAVLAASGQRQELTGQVLGRGILADLTVIRLPAGRTYPTLPLGNSDAVTQGDDITAWGYPSSSFLGDDPTLTRGIISSTNRVFKDTKYLQTDATIAGGSSGGPVVDRFGSVVGVNTAGLVQIQDDGTRVPVPGIYLAIASDEVSTRLDTMAAGGPASAAYRNLRFGYGYSMAFAKGWYLANEREYGSTFIPYTGRRYAEIFRYDFRPPFGSRSNALDSLADYIWNNDLPQQSETWAYFEKVSRRKVTVSGTEAYRLEYRARFDTDLCLMRIVSMVGVSNSYSRKPYGFEASSAICEDSLTSAYQAERQTMLNNFRP